MIPARDINITERAGQSGRLPDPARTYGTPDLQYATISTADGRFMTGGLARLDGGATKWRATLSQLDRPGHVASMYFSAGVREVLLRLEDGRSARARITGTSFIAASERICELAGIEPLG
jgi:hypothetical protein